MKLHVHGVSSTKALFEEGLQADVEAMQATFREKLDEVYVKPNPFSPSSGPTTYEEDNLS